MLQKIITRHWNVSKNVISERRDVGNQHGTAVDNKSRKIKCNYCHMEYSDGVFGLSTI
jgi:hypothetical protein